MGNSDGYILPQHLLQAFRRTLDAVHAVVEIVHLPAALELAANGLPNYRPIVFQHIGLHRSAVVWRLFDGAHIANTRKGHVEGTGNRRCRQRQRVHLRRPFTELFLMAHAEALLLIDDEKSQILKRQVLRQQLVGADKQVHPALFHPLQNFLHLLGAAESRQHFDGNRERAEAILGRHIVLLGKNGGGHQNRRLLPVKDTLHHGAECYLRLAVAHIAAEKAIHGNGALHIPFDLCSGAELILRLLVGEGILKLPLPRAVG